jgi:FkbM family methyltransferase
MQNCQGRISVIAPCLIDSVSADKHTRYDLLIRLFIEPLHEDHLASVRQFVYLPSIITLTHPRLFFIDAGARDFKGSTGEWFLHTYIRDITRPFHIFAFEPDPRFAAGFKKVPNLTFFPYAVHTTNETLKFGGDMGSIGGGSLTVQAIDFSDFLRRNFRDEDFLVLKLDIEGAEVPVLKKLIAEKTIYLIDELFMECHDTHVYWIKDMTRADCVQQTKSLRDMGIYAHEWS